MSCFSGACMNATLTSKVRILCPFRSARASTTARPSDEGVAAKSSHSSSVPRLLKSLTQSLERTRSAVFWVSVQVVSNFRLPTATDSCTTSKTWNSSSRLNSNSRPAASCTGSKGSQPRSSMAPRAMRFSSWPLGNSAGLFSLLGELFSA